MVNMSPAGRPPATLNGARSLAEIRAREVYEIIRSLKGPENRPVRFREVWPRLASKTEHRNEVNWKKLTTERSIALLVKEGWVQRTVDGYVDLDSPEVVFYGFKSWVDRILARWSPLIRGQPPAGLRRAMSRADFDGYCFGVTTELCYAAGLWSRRIDERLRSMVERPHSRYRFGSSTTRGADLASVFARGYFHPEAERQIHGAVAPLPLGSRSRYVRARDMVDAAKPPEVFQFPITLNMVPVATWAEFERAMSRFLRWQRSLDHRPSLSAYRNVWRRVDRDKLARLVRAADLLGRRKRAPTRKRRRTTG